MSHTKVTAPKFPPPPRRRLEAPEVPSSGASLITLLPTPPRVGYTGQVMKEAHKRNALTRLKTIRGHLDGVISMVEDDRYCPDVMKQVSALQASLERVNRIVLQNHLETCVADAVREHRAGEIVDELMETMKYTAAVTGPAPRLDLEVQ